MSAIAILRTTEDEDLYCAECGRPANCGHHRQYRSNGGSDEPENLRPLCFYCHHKHHADQGDWARWGRTGGQVTAQNPVNWLYNLKWARTMRREAYDLWLLHLAYHTGELSVKPPTLKQWRELQNA